MYKCTLLMYRVYMYWCIVHSMRMSMYVQFNVGLETEASALSSKHIAWNHRGTRDKLRTPWNYRRLLETGIRLRRLSVV